MLLGGDEMGRTQRGNNNAYCHDSELSWVDGRSRRASARSSTSRARSSGSARRTRPPPARLLLGPPLGRRHEGRHLAPARRPRDDGGRLEGVRRACVRDARARRGSDERDERGQPIAGDSLLVCLNGGAAPRAFALPAPRRAGAWRAIVDTAHADAGVPPSDTVQAAAYSLVLLRWEAAP
jgi:glycogen operon protein